jgi:methylenetetrahydrofolate/methylenetetrahydromethanopterin dehydrogenase (NADP+)
MNKPKILIQFDTDCKASVFDAVVAIDAGVDHLLPYSSINAEDVRNLVHGAMYTRGPADLKNTAIFIGGSDVNAGEKVAKLVKSTMFDPFRVSVMLDSNGANSTAAAAVLVATKHMHLENSKALVMAATGSVGQRVCRILANANCDVVVASRSIERSKECVQRLVDQGAPATRLTPTSSLDSDSLSESLNSCDAVFCCGAAGVQLLNADLINSSKSLRVAIDLNAVPPCGIQGIELTDKGTQRGQRFDYGALGVGNLKMKIHKASIAALFQSNTLFLDCQEMLAIGREILSATNKP